MARSTKKDERKEEGLVVFLKKHLGWQDFVALIIIILYFTTIHRYALISYQSGCNILSLEQVEQQGYVRQGYTQTYYNDDTNKTEVQVKILTEDPSVSKHELVHVMQFEQGRMYTCDNPIGRYLNEAEAYIMQNFPPRVLNAIYGTKEF